MGNRIQQVEGFALRGQIVFFRIDFEPRVRVDIHGFETTTEEQNILIARLEATLAALGDSRPKLTQDEIDVLVRARQAERDLARKQA